MGRNLADSRTAPTRDTVRARVREIITRLAPNPGALPPPGEHARLVEQLGYDSLALLELAFEVEETFGLRPMDVQTASTIHTSDELEAYVLRELRLD